MEVLWVARSRHDRNLLMHVDFRALNKRVNSSSKIQLYLPLPDSPNIHVFAEGVHCWWSWRTDYGHCLESKDPKSFWSTCALTRQIPVSTPLPGRRAAWWVYIILITEDSFVVNEMANFSVEREKSSSLAFGIEPGTRNSADPAEACKLEGLNLKRCKVSPKTHAYRHRQAPIVKWILVPLACLLTWRRDEWLQELIRRINYK